MAKLFEYNEKDVPQFQKEVCPTCVMEGSCIKEGFNEHWFLMCPHYHKWKLGYNSWVCDQLKYQKEHPDEMEIETPKNKKIAKLLSTSKKSK